jgi:ferredoxin--NADP+ reductase
MTAEPAPVGRPAIGPPTLNATIVGREDQTSSLARFWVRPDEPIAFAPGQYLTLGIVVDGRLVMRPYSAASTCEPALRDGVELYVRRVAGGALTVQLWDRPVGERVRLTGPKGRFTLPPDDPRVHLFVSSGTGSAPFVAMLRERIAAGRPPRAIVLNGVSHAADLGYRELFGRWDDRPDVPVTFVPTISRPDDPANAGWRGRVGRVETVVASVCAEAGLHLGDTVAYLCGNPSMISATELILGEWGLPTDAIRVERYWPPASEPRGAAPGATASLDAAPHVQAHQRGEL